MALPGHRLAVRALHLVIGAAGQSVDPFDASGHCPNYEVRGRIGLALLYNTGAHGLVRLRRVRPSVDLPGKARRWGRDLRGSRRSSCLRTPNEMTSRWSDHSGTTDRGCGWLGRGHGSRRRSVAGVESRSLHAARQHPEIRNRPIGCSRRLGRRPAGDPGIRVRPACRGPRRISGAWWGRGLGRAAAGWCRRACCGR